MSVLQQYTNKKWIITVGVFMIVKYSTIQHVNPQMSNKNIIKILKKTWRSIANEEKKKYLDIDLLENPVYKWSNDIKLNF